MKKKSAFLLCLLLAFASVTPLMAKHHAYHGKKIKYESNSRHTSFNVNFSPTDLFLGLALLNSTPVVRERAVVAQPVIQQPVYYAAPQYYYPTQVIVSPQPYVQGPTYVQQTYVYR